MFKSFYSLFQDSSKTLLLHQTELSRFYAMETNVSSYFFPEISFVAL